MSYLSSDITNLIAITNNLIVSNTERTDRIQDKSNNTFPILNNESGIVYSQQ